ncbi:MAG TPA: penicillin acylase family protein [Acetobacteraceae bacterium]|nr:penicillin acylase family protein [Acetobacteraceae bacterium]
MTDPTTRAYTLPGLEHPAEILVDRWGIPHIRAESQHDVFFVQGFNAARDRLYQIDLWRKRGLGQMAADYGPGFLAQDRAARLFLYRGDMAAEWAAYGNPNAQAICAAFAGGINAYIALAEQDPSLLPPEFVAMDIRPARWQPEDVVRIRSHALCRNVESEVLRARVAAHATLDTDRARRSIEPPWDLRLPEGLDPADIPAEVLDDYWLATVDPDISPERLAATPDSAWRWTKVNDFDEVTQDAAAEGSNNWVIAPTRTATGRPILASDPHRTYQMPSVRSVVHLTCPGMDVIGATEPPTPGVFIGHNDRLAFGLTIFPMDQEDLYVYQTHPDDPDQYRYGDGWERMRVVEEQVAVRGMPPQTVTLKFTRHGPVVHADAAKHRAFAVRSVWSEPGTSAYMGRLAYMTAQSVQQHGEALRHWSAPTVNQISADLDGNIGWFAVGKAPRRPNWDGLLPVPGDGRYEWDGFHPLEDLPRRINPPRGFVATANEMNMPPDYPALQRKLGFEWAERSRSNRVHAVLDAQPQHDIADSMALQCDVFSIPAQRIGRLLDRITNTPAGLETALAMLRGWDHQLRADSAAAALFEVWWVKHLKSALLNRVSSDPTVRPLLVPGDNETLLAMLEAAEPASLGTLLADTLGAAFTQCRSLLGDDPATWRWGRLHHGYFTHPLSRVAGQHGLRDVGPLPLGGSGSTPMNTTYRATNFRATVGASFRMVVDVGNWDNSRVINTPGQSGNPTSPHYDDMAPLWARGEYVPMLYSREAVDSAAELRIVLRPEKA